MQDKFIYAIDTYDLCGNVIEFKVTKETPNQYVAVKTKTDNMSWFDERTIRKSTMQVGSLYFEETKELAKARQIDLLMLRVAANKKSIEDKQNQNLRFEKKLKELTEDTNNGR